jgi:16S rRNA (cytosine967-C5)-methyltransferase
MDRQPLSAADRAFLTVLACGVVRHQTTLDHVLGSFSDRPAARIEPAVLDALRLGLYQVLFLERVPPSAAVDETVNLVRKEANRRAAGFVNGVLRSVLRSVRWSEASEAADARHRLPCSANRVAVFDRPILPNPGGSPGDWLSLAYGLPKWLVERWLGRFGWEVTEKICQSGNASPPLHVRWRSGGPAPAAFEPVEGMGGFYCVQQAGSVSDLPGFGDGHIIVQGVPSGRSVLALRVEAGAAALDVCAAPGVKAAHLADLTGPGGRVIVVDKSLGRMRKLKENVTRLRIMNVRPLVGDATCLGDWLVRRFDRILVDVPCSNTGELCRRVEVRHRVQPGDIRRLVELQSALLAAAAGLLKPYGYLVYSTCSLEEEEGPGVVKAFLARNASCELQEEQWMFPHENGSAGGYFARLARLRN